ncbi:hypothetical protein F7725_002217 [Dissostichus mawsoni]|uniref:Uncharacterized protein n=1 Tax=Dissostichus mawsoni TaxID=36200 RepID=A0A7J5Y4X8_DISMA|nr:hypothetical protein F7725_002217 [Dissostichus mawsoni]
MNSLHLLPVEHLHQHLLDADGANDGSEEELRHHRRADGPQHGQSYEQFGKPRRVLAVDQPHVLVQSLVRLATQRLDEGFDGFYIHHRDPGRPPALSGQQLALSVGQPGEDPLQHAGLHRLRGLKVHPVLSQPQHQQRSPAAPDQHQLVVLRQLTKAGDVFHEPQRLHQNRRGGFAGDLRGAEDAPAPGGSAGARLLPELLQRGRAGGGGALLEQKAQ